MLGKCHKLQRVGCFLERPQRGCSDDTSESMKFCRCGTAAVWLDKAVSLYDPTGPRYVGPAQCKMPVDHPIGPWVSKKCTMPCWQVLSSLFLNLPRCPCEKIKSLFSWRFASLIQNTIKGILIHSLTSVPVAVCGCLASSPRWLDTSTICTGRLWLELWARRRPALSRLCALPLVESSLDWCSLQNWKRRNRI